MRSFRLLSLVLLVFLLSCFPCRAERSHRSRLRHFSNTTTKYKRDANAVFTYFSTGLGACGITNTASDFIVALNSAEYDGGAHCFEMITITVNGKVAQAQITDQCPGCAVGGLDFTEGLFQYFAPLSVGELQGSWSYNSDIASSSPTATSSSTSDTPSWTPTATTSTTMSSSTALSTSTTTSLASTTVLSPTSTATTGPSSTTQDPQMIAQINLALIELGALLQASL